MKITCGVKGCKEKLEGAWFDIVDDVVKVKNYRDRPFGRVQFCKKHFDIIMPYAKLKEKEQCDEHHMWCFVPLSIVEEALNRG